MAIITDTITHLKLNEASGTRVDAHGAYDFSDVNSVGSDTGKLGDAAEFDGTNNRALTLADNADWSVGDQDFMFAVWVYVSNGGFRPVFLKTSPTATDYMLYHDGTNFVFSVWDGGASQKDAPATTFGSPSLDTWYFVVCWHDSVNNQLGIRVNDGTKDTVSHTTGVRDSASASVFIGNYLDTFLWNGRVDSLSFWHAIKSDADQTALYNSGNGLDYDNWPVTATVRQLASAGVGV